VIVRQEDDRFATRIPDHRREGALRKLGLRARSEIAAQKLLRRIRARARPTVAEDLSVESERDARRGVRGEPSVLAREADRNVVPARCELEGLPRLPQQRLRHDAREIGRLPAAQNADQAGHEAEVSVPPEKPEATQDSRFRSRRRFSLTEDANPPAARGMTASSPHLQTSGGPPGRRSSLKARFATLSQPGAFV
jgi:hypothetical protein